MRAASLTASVRELDLAIVRWMARFGPTLPRVGLGKNLVLISAGMVVGATVRGGVIVADPLRRRGRPSARRGDR